MGSSMNLTTTEALQVAGQVAGALGRAAIEGGALVLAVWALCRFFPRLPAALRTWLWWIACLRLLVGLAMAPVRLPLLPPPAAAAPAATVATASPASPTGAVVPRTVRISDEAAPAALSWPAVLGALWLLALLVQLAPAARQLRRLRGALRFALPVTDGGLHGLWEDLCREMGVSEAQLLIAAEGTSPQAVGLLRPRVLLPGDRLARLSPAELKMVLCHELAHLRRGDLWLGWVPAVAERLFFFHPLAVLAAREYTLAREAACDATVLAVLGEAPQAYGRLLLTLGIAPRPAGLSALATAATAAPSRQHLKRRLEMLDQASRSRRPHLGWWCLLGLFALFALVPFRIVAAQEASQALRLASPPPQPPRPPRAPVAPRAPRPLHHSAKSGDEYVLVSANGSTTMNGSMVDVDRARQLLGPGEKEILWFRQGGKEYVVRDPQTLKAALALFAPQAELGSRQAALGARQAELGSRQAALGAEQAKLGSQQAKLGAEQARVASDEARETSDGKEVNDRLMRQQDELGKKQDELGRQQDELGRKQDALGREQDALGKQQDALGRQQDKLGQEAEEKFHALVSDAISRGLAKEVGR
ncbi:MAG: bla regulator protein blaR1 [Acidobacteriota bacterium]|jgi:beta-lactamase regulating signal transducer with metallopeptidase domain|nr:bla regulator protein blaR1 [Acidobacteriota bacterium]